MKLVSGLTAIIIILSAPNISRAEEPLSILKQNITQSIHILNDPQYAPPAKRTAQFQALVNISLKLFDFEEFSKRVVASQWKLFNPDEKRRFVDLLTQFLCNLYLTRLQEIYTDETVTYVSQKKLSDSKALVATKVIWKNRDIPVDVWMLKRRGQWRIYDTHVVGISFLRLYQVQFHALLKKNSPGQVLNRIEEKLTDQKRRKAYLLP
jgi:ABC-type transporter MlaC component